MIIIEESILIWQNNRLMSTSISFYLIFLIFTLPMNHTPNICLTLVQIWFFEAYNCLISI